MMLNMFKKEILNFVFYIVLLFCIVGVPMFIGWSVTEVNNKYGNFTSAIYWLLWMYAVLKFFTSKVLFKIVFEWFEKLYSKINKEN
ncbi:MAG: hypothetical protein QG564_1832 [Campylobacterota bacterium]|nr:hypothetical protein [Campylobacterota bacterium]